MANDFSALTAAVDTLAAEIADAVAILTSPDTDNNDQQVIDAITARLSSAADALKAALPADDSGATEAPAA